MRQIPFQLRGSLQTVLSLRLLAPQEPSFFPRLVDKVAHSPDFFRDAPLVLDVGHIANEPPLDLEDFVRQLRGHRLLPVGIQNGSPAWNEAALRAGLAVFGAGSPARESAERPEAEPKTPPASPLPVSPPPPRRIPARVVREPVRGGQQVVAPEGDLVVMAAVSPGAELAAAGHIHVYGTLRGRAFAGIDGDETAMIFCDSFEAELLSIAGVHLVNEEIDPKLLRKRVRVALLHEQIVVSPAP